jgi:hypothetical protein
MRPEIRARWFGVAGQFSGVWQECAQRVDSPPLVGATWDGGERADWHAVIGACDSGAPDCHRNVLEVAQWHFLATPAGSKWRLRGETPCGCTDVARRIWLIGIHPDVRIVTQPSG